jgi:hypothetical protein
MGDEHQGDGRGAHEVQPEGDDKVGVQKSPTGASNHEQG